MITPYNIVIEETNTTIQVGETNYDVVIEETPEHNIVIEASDNVVVVDQTTPIIVEIPMGPQGLPGINEADMTYARRVDFVNDNLLYKGEAVVGTSDSSPLWRIHKIVIGNDDDVTETWAGGNDSFAHIWNDRLTLVYA